MIETTDKSALDSLISSDLAALASDTRQGLPTIDESFESVDAGAYRDGTEGALARRDSLLVSRRLELAMMPLTTGRVFVHRVARVAAGATASIAAVFVIILIADPVLQMLVGFFIPELTLPLIGVSVVAGALGAYVLSGLIAERVFDRRMRSALESRGDAFEDIDALSRGPLDEARALTNKVDGWSTAVPLIGVATCVPLFSFLSLIYAPQLASAFRPSTLRDSSHPWMASNLGFVLLAAAVGIIVAVFIGRACNREHRTAERSALLTRLSHWSVIPIALVFGLVVVVFLGRAVGGLGFDTLPSTNMRAFLAVGGTLALLIPVSFVALLVRRSEERRLDSMH